MDSENDVEVIEHVNVPILFLIFNRPDKSQKVFEVIRKARPKQLFIAADGPRDNKPDEIQKCEETRAIVKTIDWPCEVHTLFRDSNLGCGRAVSGAISWFFEQVEEGIILEDDTLPGPGFFQFCSEMLEKYRNDTRIMSVSGCCLPCQKWNDSGYSYFFSNWDYMWGWATWRRAWKLYDYKMEGYPHVVAHHYFAGNYYPINMKNFINHVSEKSYYKNDEVTWWSYQWGFKRKINSGLVIVPNKNMVTNIGFGLEATNTKDSKRGDALTLDRMEFPLKHPEFVMIDRLKDDQIFKENLTIPGSTLRNLIKEMIPSQLKRIFSNK